MRGSNNRYSFQCTQHATAQQLGIAGVPTVANVIKVLDVPYSDFLNMQFPDGNYLNDHTLDNNPFFPNTNLACCYDFDMVEYLGWEEVLRRWILFQLINLSYTKNKLLFSKNLLD